MPQSHSNDTRTSADVAWDIAVDRCSWRALRPQLTDDDDVESEMQRSHSFTRSYRPTHCTVGY